jgi:hypothetical protein
MVPQGHSAINRARAMFTCGPSEKFERIRHERRSVSGDAPLAGERLLSIIP